MSGVDLARVALRAALEVARHCQAAERQVRAMRELSARALPDVESMPDDVPAAMEAARASAGLAHLVQAATAIVDQPRCQRAEHGIPTLAQADLGRLTQQPRIATALRRDRRRTAAQRALLREQLARYPVDDAQVAPTRLGNAIRRFEEYGYDRFRLDTQVLWNELTGTCPEPLRRQVDLARASVDFFVALLAGHTVVASAAVAALASSDARPATLTVTAAILACLTIVWYRCAVTATDEWAAAVRGLVNTGRKPLAENLGLVLPANIADERVMWALVGKLSRLPYDEKAGALNRYRYSPPSGNQ